MEKVKWGRWLKASYEKTAGLQRGLGFYSTSNEEPLESLGVFWPCGEACGILVP